MSKAVYHLILSDGAQSDMHACRKKDGYAAAVIAQLLRELENDPGTCACLVNHDYSDDDIASVSELWSLQDVGLNAYRVRFVALGRWRMITAADHRKSRIGVLAIMPRDDDYEASPGLWARIKKDYDDLDFPLLGR